MNVLYKCSFFNQIQNLKQSCTSLSVQIAQDVQYTQVYTIMYKDVQLEKENCESFELVQYKQHSVQYYYVHAWCTDIQNDRRKKESEAKPLPC